VHVTTAIAALAPAPRQIIVTGTLEPDRRTSLAANASGRVTQTFVERGQMVAQGAVLARLDVRTATLGAEEAAANLENLKSEAELAKRDCERNEVLMKKGALSQQQYDKIRAGCVEVDAQMRALEKRLNQATQVVSDGTIRAPFSGLVTERLVSAGDYVQASSSVVSLVVIDSLRLKLTIPEMYAADVKAGTKVVFSPTALPDRDFTAAVRYVSGEVRQTTRDVVVEAIVDNPNGSLLPGMFVKARVSAGERSLPTVPTTAVVSEGAHKYIYVVDEHRLEQRVVRIAFENNDTLAIERGLEAGDRFVLAPTPELVDGSLVD
jgi:RND family efflux transporter MFP subunit